MTTPREIIAETYGGFFAGDRRVRPTDFTYADILIRNLTAAGFSIVKTEEPLDAGAEAPCRHEWYLGRCCHCEIAVKDFRAMQGGKPS